VYHENKPTYVGCSVAAEWHLFSVFREWMISQEWKGLQLDKDLLVIGNKVYSPETCLFIPRNINTLLTNHSINSDGVKEEKRWGGGRFTARLSMYGTRRNIGTFGSAGEANEMYKATKIAYMLELAWRQVDSRIRNGLLRHVAFAE
jgi:hypothetical protein